MFQSSFNATFPSNDLSSSSTFQLSRLHQNSQIQHYQQLQHRQKNIFPTMEQSPIHTRSPEQTKATNHSPIATSRHNSTTPTTRQPTSPPPALSNPENNTCRLMDYRNQAVAAFTVDSKELICLPQAFELFLKHLVGGLHTVYTKLKRLDVVPVVCNVEQVRVLRSLGAIQPGVNRCKLISPKEFDILYEDCTNSSARPGRPPKRSGNVGMATEVMKKQRLQINNDFYQSHHHPSPTTSYLEPIKKPSFSHPYLSLTEPKPSLLPSYPINFLPFGHPGFMNFMASHLATGRQLAPSLFDFNASARFNEMKHQQSLAVVEKKEEEDSKRFTPPYNKEEMLFHKEKISQSYESKRHKHYDDDEDDDSDKISSSQQQSIKNDKVELNTPSKVYKNGDICKEDYPLNLEMNKSDAWGARKEKEEEEERVENKKDKNAEPLMSENSHVDTPEIVTMEMMLINMQAIVKMVAEKMKEKNQKHVIEKDNLLRKLEEEKEARLSLETKLRLLKGREENHSPKNPFHPGIPHQVIQSPSFAKDTKYSTKDSACSFSGNDFKYPSCISPTSLTKPFKKKNEDERCGKEEEEEEEGDHPFNNSEHGIEVGQVSPVNSPEAIVTQLKNQSNQFNLVNGSCKE